jgi:hypothetical protein
MHSVNCQCSTLRVDTRYNRRIYALLGIGSKVQREVHRRDYRDAPDVGEGRPKIECIGVVQFYFCFYFHNTENIRFSQPGLEIKFYDIKENTVKNTVIYDKMAKNQLLK